MRPIRTVSRTMQPSVDARRSATPPDGLVIGVVATGQQSLRAALRRVAAVPALLDATERIVVVDRGRAPAATLLAEAVRLPAGLLRVERNGGEDQASALARLLAATAEEVGAHAVLVLDDSSLTEPDILLEAFRLARRSAASDVVGLRAPDADAAWGPAAWWGAVIPLDAVRAVGWALPEAGDHALADLVLRAESAGFRSTVVAVAGPVPSSAGYGAGRLLLGLLHAPLRARTALLAVDLAADARHLLALRPGEVLRRHAELRALLGGAAASDRAAALAGDRIAAERHRFAALPADSLRLHARLWHEWPSLRRASRSGALDRASAASWTARFATSALNPALPVRERSRTSGRTAGLRSRMWSTARRGTSAA